MEPGPGTRIGHSKFAKPLWYSLSLLAFIIVYIHTPYVLRRPSVLHRARAVGKCSRRCFLEYVCSRGGNGSRAPFDLQVGKYIQNFGPVYFIIPLLLLLTYYIYTRINQFRSIGGQLDMFFIPGPTPEQVIIQYHEMVGRPYLPPYWALGYQFCRYGYKDLAELNATITRIVDAKIPIDGVFAVSWNSNIHYIT